MFHVVRSFLFISLLSITASASADSVDPIEPVNRAVFAFNETVDRYLLLPATKGYKAITPDFVESGISNFFNNLGDVVSLVSNLLQLKPHAVSQDFARVVFNSTFGLFGVIDVATPMGLPRQNEDIGQALGYWGVGAGPYLMLPLLGPTTLRDGVSLIPEGSIHPSGQISDTSTSIAYNLLYALDKRAELMQAEKLISGDRYTFIRDAYLQRREFLVKDGQIGDSYGDDGF